MQNIILVGFLYYEPTTQIYCDCYTWKKRQTKFLIFLKNTGTCAGQDKFSQTIKVQDSKGWNRWFSVLWTDDSNIMWLLYLKKKKAQNKTSTFLEKRKELVPDRTNSHKQLQFKIRQGEIFCRILFCEIEMSECCLFKFLNHFVMSLGKCQTVSKFTFFACLSDRPLSPQWMSAPCPFFNRTRLSIQFSPQVQRAVYMVALKSGVFGKMVDKHNLRQFWSVPMILTPHGKLEIECELHRSTI